MPAGAGSGPQKQPHSSGALRLSPPPPLEALDRNTPDPAKKALSDTASALERLGRELEILTPPTLRQIAVTLRTAAAASDDARASGMPSLVSSRDPILGNLHERLRDLANLLFVLAETPEHLGAGRGHCQSASEHADLLVKAAVAAIVEREEQLLAEHFPSARLLRIPSEKRDSPELVADRWLVLVPLDDPAGLDELTSALPALQSLAFRIYVLVETDEGAVLPALGVRLGAGRAWPMEASDIQTLSEEAGLCAPDNSDVDRLQTFVRALHEASRAVALKKLRVVGLDPSAPAEDAVEALSAARVGIESCDDATLKFECERLLDRIESEHDDGESEFLHQLARSETGTPTEASATLDQLLLSLLLGSSLPWAP